jgi:hypothetical protein
MNPVNADADGSNDITPDEGSSTAGLQSAVLLHRLLLQTSAWPDSPFDQLPTLRLTLRRAAETSGETWRANGANYSW